VSVHFAEVSYGHFGTGAGVLGPKCLYSVLLSCCFSQLKLMLFSYSHLSVNFRPDRQFGVDMSLFRSVLRPKCANIDDCRRPISLYKRNLGILRSA